MGERSLILYHGTDSKILTPDLTRCNAYRDFGRAFYLSYNKGLARNWAEKKNRTQAKVNGYGLVLNNVEEGCLKIKRFKADEKWAKFVYENRTKEGYVRPDYDIVIGPIADNTLQDWFNKMDEEGLSFSAIAPKIRYEKFKDNQFAFCSSRAIKLLKWVECL